MNWKLCLGLLVFFALLMSSSYTLLIPFLPVYLVRELGSSQQDVNLWSGVIFAITFAISAVVSPLWGRLSDRTGRKLMMLRSSILLAICYFLGGIVQTPWQLLGMRALQGFAAGLWPACLAMLSAYVPKNKIGISMGLMQSANICGGIVGPLLGGVLAAAFGMRNSFFVGAAGLSLITILTIVFIKEPTREHSHQLSSDAPKVKPPSLMKTPGILYLLGAACLTMLVIQQVQPVMTTYIATFDGTDGNRLMLISGAVFSLGGLAGAFAAPFWGRAGQRRGFFYTMCLSFLVTGIASVIQGIPDVLWLFALMQFVIGLCFSGIFPSANSLLVLLTPPERRGESFSLFFAAQQVGGAVGPILGGITATLLTPRLVFFSSGFIMLSIATFVFIKGKQTLYLNLKEHDGHRQGISQDFIEKIKQETAADLSKKEHEKI